MWRGTSGASLLVYLGADLGRRHVSAEVNWRRAARHWSGRTVGPPKARIVYLTPSRPRGQITRMDNNSASATEVSADDEQDYEDVGSVLEVTRNGRAKVTEGNTGHGS